MTTPKTVAIVRNTPSYAASALKHLLVMEGYRAKLCAPDSAWANTAKSVINWGINGSPRADALNSRVATTSAADKVACNDVLLAADVPAIKYHRGITLQQAKELYPTSTIVGRWKLSANSGDGIGVFKQDAGLPAGAGEAKAYAAYLPKSAEYRVFVVDGRCVGIYQKKKRSNAVADDPLASYIRSVGSYWKFCQSDLLCDKLNNRSALMAISVRAVNALGLDFGAVDVLWTKDERYVVCEVNTKPGVTSSTSLAWLGGGIIGMIEERTSA